MNSPILPKIAAVRPTALSIFLLIFSFLVTQSHLWAGTEPVLTKRLTGKDLKKDTSIVTTDIKSTTPSLRRQVLKTDRVLNTVTLSIDEILAGATTLPFKFSYSVSFSISGKDFNGRRLPPMMRTLTLDCDSGTTTVSALRQSFSFNNYHSVSIKVTAISYHNKVNGVILTGNGIPPVFSLSSDIAINRVLQFDCYGIVTGLSSSVKNLSTISDKQDRAYIAWSNYLNFDEYDLEWTFYDAESDVVKNQGDASSDDFDFLFANNATRVVTKNMSYAITLVYPKGQLYYRVRAAHYATNGQREVSQWSSTLSASTPLKAFPNIILLDGHDTDWNWQTQQIFAEDGKQTQSLKYFDASLRERQTQALSNAANTVIVGETIYDYQGRPTLKVMPAPMPNASLGYVNDLSDNLARKEYSRADFIPISPTDCADDIPAMSAKDSKGAANYFSPANPLSTSNENQYTPDAEGYPFAVTEFTPDATGRIRRQSGVGANFKLGSKHETQYFYAKPSQEELDRLFGIDAGDAKTYLKNMVVDANGQGSIAYIDAHGRTVATALAGATTENLNELKNDATGQVNATQQLTKNLLNNAVTDNSITSSYVLPVHTEGVHTIAYLLNGTGLNFEDVCNMRGTDVPVCYTCAYDLNIDITSDDCTFAPLNYNVSDIRLNDVCAATTGIAWDNKKNGVFPTLKRGTYQITKRLTVSQKAIEKNWDSYLANADCLPTRADFVKKAIDTLSYFQCQDTLLVDDCDLCKNIKSFGQFETYYNALHRNDTRTTVENRNSTATLQEIALAYDKFEANCRLVCSDECSLLYQNLLSDVAPSGQYGVIPTTSGGYRANDETSVYRNDYYKSTNYVYLNDDSMASEVVINGVSKTPNALSLTEFVRYWQPSWAYALVKAHPEYCYYEWCSQTNPLPNRSDWFNFDDTLPLQTYYKIYTELPMAALKNLPLSTDPLFGLLTDAERTKINKVGMRTNGQPITIFDVAKITTYCPGAATPEDCSVLDPNAGRTGCSGQDSLFWVTLRTLYLANRKQVIYERREQDHLPCSATVKTIGKKGEDTPYKDKMRRVFLPSDLPKSPQGGSIVLHKNDVIANLAIDYDDNCKGLADLWLEKLACLNPSATQKANMKTAFIEICKKGSDLEHPMGSTSVPLSINPSTVTIPVPKTIKRVIAGRIYYFTIQVPTPVRSIEDVVNIYFPTNGACTDCNATLISAPGAYEDQYIAPKTLDKITPADKTAICNKFSQLEILYEQVGVASGFTKFEDFFNAQSVITLNSVEFERIKNLCSNPVDVSCAFIGSATTIPPQLDGNRCKTCDNLNTLVNQYNVLCALTNYKSRFLTLEKANIEVTRLVRWLNSKTSMNLDANEYLLFMSQCYKKNTAHFTALRGHINYNRLNYNDTWLGEAQKPPTLLCPRPLTYEEEFIDSSCFFSVRQEAINDANLQYDALLEATKRSFFKRYTDNCLQKALNAETFTDNGPTKEYHYTLYYYDQAGNLVQTVPPSGVVPLTDAELLQFSKSKGIVAHYPFTADLKDYSNSGLHLTQTDGGAADISNTEGVLLNSNTSLLSAETNLLDNDQHTIDFWARFPANITNGSWGNIFSCRPDWNGDEGWYGYAPTIRFNPSWRGGNKTITWYYDNGESGSEMRYRNNGLDTWHHITGVKKEQIFSFYLDGVKVQELSNMPTGSPFGERIAPLVFGRNTRGGIAIGADAYLKDFKIFNRSLSDAEVVELNTGTIKLRPTHTLVTQYWYNSLNKVTRQTSPDGGTSFFWYDYLGRLILSQNANQYEKIENDQVISGKAHYSYTHYDKLGRTTEVGEIYGYHSLYDFSPINVTTYYQRVDAFVKTLRTEADFLTNPNTGASYDVYKTQVTRTHYEAPPQYVGTIPDFSPENLRNRVAVVTYATDPQNGSFDMATHYSYDIAGNVKTIVHNIPQLANQIYVLNGSTRNHRYKRLDYDYDLVSGKVNKLHYQKGEPDYFVYRYDYDPDNRLQFANSSIDDNCWILEASYFYYKHGPLSRIELGRKFNKVQGLDYAYTLQGWIKGLNASFLDPNRDMGKDGIGTSTVRKDAVGYTINYFDDDYKPIGATAKTDAGRFDVKMTNQSGDYRSKGLFNGNIRSIASQTEGLGKPILMSYDYDQLNRLNKMESNALTINTNTWNRATPAESRWREDVTYDANGNIKAYKRNDQFGTVLMDNLQYNYTPNTNQLASVADYAPPSTYKDDVEGATGNNFQYDKIGNLTYETKNGNRSVSFNWNVYGKMLTAYDWDYDAQNVVVASYAQYSYDAQQNRFKKQQTTSRLVNSVWQTQTSTDYYIRDAQGNVLAIYQQKDNNFVWKEQHLYGSSRLGMWQPEKVLSGVVLPMLGVCGDGQGVRLYELTNHLGNVLATINDKGKVVSAQDYYPFGLKLDGRMFNTEGYRFGFNGKEYDGKFKSQDYGMRIYRPDLGKFLSVDPLSQKYPWNSVYSFAENDVIRSIDLDGSEKKTVYLHINTNGSVNRLKTYVNILQNQHIQLGIHRYASTQTYYVLPSGTILDGGIMTEQVGRNGKNSAGIYPSARYDYNDKNPNYDAETSQRIEEDGGYLAGYGDGHTRRIINARNESAPEKKAEMSDFYSVVELGLNVASAGVPFIILKAESRILANADGSVEYHYTQRDGSAMKIIDNRAKRPRYENPGHHDPSGGALPFRGGGAKKTEIIPNNHEELWRSATPDVNGPLTNGGVAKNWYAKDSNGQIHRFQADHNNAAHWSGSSGGASGLAVPDRIIKQLNQ